MPSTTSVLIAGSGLNGLSTALFLAQRKIACILVERDPDTPVRNIFEVASITERAIVSSGSDGCIALPDRTLTPKICRSEAMFCWLAFYVRLPIRREIEY